MLEMSCLYDKVTDMYSCIFVLSVKACVVVKLLEQYGFPNT